MSNKSGIAAQIITRPQGGGALKGIGETFAPDLHTGTGNFTIPINLLPGRNGLQPEIKLAYSTGSGNGPFGLGWSLSLPTICRKTAKGVPQYDNTADTFILSGLEDLVPVATSATGQYYQPRTAGLLARIEHHTENGNNFWQVWGQDGSINIYGTPRPADAGSDWMDPATVADPINRNHIFCWYLSRTVDTFGNQIVYTYERDAAADGPHEWDQLYLKQVQYVDYAAAQQQTQFLVSLSLEYQDRPDPFSDYRAGFEIRTRYRCHRFILRTHAAAEQLVRTYDLVYLDERQELPNLEDQLPLNRVSLLSQFHTTGHDGAESQSLPPIEVAYTRFEPARRRFFPIQGEALPVQSLTDPHTELADLFGNGLPDIVQMDETVRYWRNLGNGRFDRPRQMATAPTGLQLGHPGVQLIDANGDGRVDLLVTQNEMAGYYALQFNGEWDRRSFQRYQFAPSINLQSTDVRLLDLDGDGVTDALRANGTFECYFNNPVTGWQKSRRVPRRSLDEFPDVTFDDPRVKLADMTGDGLQDIVLIHDGHISYWPNLGHGNWGKRVTMSHSPRYPFGYDTQRILLDDVDGDGLADLIYVDDRKVTLYINQSGNAWSQAVAIKGTPRVTDMDGVRLVDLLGSGTKGLLWSARQGATPQPHLFFLDLTGGVKPYLLHEINNHRGAITRIGYQSSTHFYLQDAARPQTHWQTLLPFPVQVVAQVEVIDQLSGGKLTSEYRYHHGYWDGDEREFRGFGRVDQLDTEAFTTYHQAGVHPTNHTFAPVAPEHFAPPTLTKTWFHLGPVSDEQGDWQEPEFSPEYWSEDPPVLNRSQAENDMLRGLPRAARRDALRTLRGSVLRTELYGLDESVWQERPYTVTEFHYGLREESPPADNSRLRIFFPHLLAERTTQWERGNDPMTAFVFTSDYDTYGHPQATLTVAVPRGRDYQVSDPAATEPYLAIYATAAYAHRNDATVYIGGRQVSASQYEISNDGTTTLSELLEAVYSGAAACRLIDHTVNFFDGPAYTGLPFGQLGEHGVLTRSESLVLTESILSEAYGVNIPPYLNPDQPPAWTPDYPELFRAQLATLAGYSFQPGGPDSPYQRGYYAVTVQNCYSERGLLLTSRDAAGAETTILYDTYQLLPVAVTDPAGLITQAEYDYRLLQACQITDVNGNQEQYMFSPLGLPASVITKGKPGENAGDTPSAPGTRWEYDVLAFSQRQQPVSVRTIQRLHHVHDTDIPFPERDETIETIQYSDGFGRLLQTRSQTDEVIFGDKTFGDAGLSPDHADPVKPAVGATEEERVLVTGWQIYNNKGQVVEKYPSFFATGWAYTPPSEAQMGPKETLFYEPRGRTIRIQHADGSEGQFIFGVPADLANPAQYTPTPWESYSYDANDNAQRTHNSGPATHWNTPTSNLVDALGRVIALTDRNGPDPLTDWYTIHSTYDIQGNLLTVTDPLGRITMRYVYDLRNQALRTEQLDNGLQLSVFDARGNDIEGRDSKGSLLLHCYDTLTRLTNTWAKDDNAGAVTLRAHLVYGDSPESGLTLAAAQQANLLEHLYQEYDEAGLTTSERYDFKGNALELVRQVIADEAILTVFPENPDPKTGWQIQPFRVDWQPPAPMSLAEYAQTLLDGTKYRVSTRYDALGRIKTLTYPEDEDGRRKSARPSYNRGGALQRLTFDGSMFINHIAYNAQGQRILIAYGNRVMTRFVYDAQTDRLARLRSERYAQPEPHVYEPSGEPLQDFSYLYDLVGNINIIQDRTPASGIPNTPSGKDALNRLFTYDPIYRLLSATGRECDLAPAFPWDAQPRCTDLTRTRAYNETYQYDAAGNLIQLSHQNSSGGFTRQLTLMPGSNRLDKVTVGTNSFIYQYDTNGNLLRETTSRHFEWDHSDQLKAFRHQTGTAEPSLHAHYLYNVGGQRVKKLVRKQGGSIAVTVYVGGIFEHHYSIQGSTTHSYNTLHVLDESGRSAEVRVGRPPLGDATPAIKYQLSDHLGSSNALVSNTGQLINREEFTPYGETSFGSFAFKRYRYTGKERDTESGLYYHGARYYAPWLARWISCDPAGTVDGLNLYTYVNNTPLMAVDPTGLQSKPTAAPKQSWLQRFARSKAGQIVAYALESTIQVADLSDLAEDPPTDRKGQMARADNEVEALNRDKIRPGELPPPDDKPPAQEGKGKPASQGSKAQSRRNRRVVRQARRDGKVAKAKAQDNIERSAASNKSPSGGRAQAKPAHPPTTPDPSPRGSQRVTKSAAPAPKPSVPGSSGGSRLVRGLGVVGKFAGIAATVVSVAQGIGDFMAADTPYERKEAMIRMTPIIGATYDASRLLHEGGGAAIDAMHGVGKAALDAAANHAAQRTTEAMIEKGYSRDVQGQAHFLLRIFGSL